jgi:hypothetical protein
MQEITGAKPVRDANFCLIRGVCVFWLNSVDWNPRQHRFGRRGFHDLHGQLAPGIRHGPTGREYKWRSSRDLQEFTRKTKSARCGMIASDPAGWQPSPTPFPALRERKQGRESSGRH